MKKQPEGGKYELKQPEVEVESMAISCMCSVFLSETSAGNVKFEAQFYQSEWNIINKKVPKSLICMADMKNVFLACKRHQF